MKIATWRLAGCVRCRPDGRLAASITPQIAGCVCGPTGVGIHRYAFNSKCVLSLFRYGPTSLDAKRAGACLGSRKIFASRSDESFIEACQLPSNTDGAPVL